MTILLLTSGAVLLLTGASFFAYEFLTFRQASLRQLSIQGEIIAANSTAALAFENVDDATSTVSDIISAGIVPGALEMLDRPILQAVEAYCKEVREGTFPDAEHAFR